MGVIDWIKNRHEERQRAKAYRKAIYMGNEAIASHQEEQLIKSMRQTERLNALSSAIHDAIRDARLFSRRIDHGLALVIARYVDELREAGYTLDDAIGVCVTDVNRHLSDSSNKADIWVAHEEPTWTARPTDGVVLSYDLGAKSLTAADSKDSATTHFQHMVVEVDSLEYPLFTEEIQSPQFPGGREVRPVDLSQAQLKELIQRYPDKAQVSDRVIKAQYYPFAYCISMPTWQTVETVPSSGQTCAVHVIRTLVNAEELWNLHQGRRNKPAEILGIKP